MRNTILQPYYKNSWALVIGINEYHHVNPLALARSDGESVAEALISQLSFPKNNIICLFDGQATRSAIMQKFLGFENLDQDDRLFVFFAGHGETVSGQRGDVGYLVPVDGKSEDKSTLIPWHELTRGSEIIPAKHILFVMDACYSGLAIQRGAKAGGRRFISDMLQRVSRQVITAGKADQTVADGGSATGQNSIFTGHLLDGLRGKAANESGIVTATHLMHHVYDKVGGDPQSHQTPHYGHFHGDGDFILSTPNNTRLFGSVGEDFLVETLPEKPESQPIAAIAEIRPMFAEKIGYANPEDEKFGQNEWSQKLGKLAWKNGVKNQIIKPSHWLAIVVEPISNLSIDFDLASLAKTMRSHLSKSDKPFEKFRMPGESITTSKSVILYNSEYSGEEKTGDVWKRFIRVEKYGGIEYCQFTGVADTYHLGRDQNNPGTAVKVFSYIQVVGIVWNFLFAAKELYRLVNYQGGVRYVVNLIGAKDSLLSQFARQAGPDNRYWHDTFDIDAMMGGSVQNWRCRDSNFQTVFQIALGSLGEAESKKLITECAENLGLAYNHQSAPRCYNHGTDIFPWQSFNPDAT